MKNAERPVSCPWVAPEVALSRGHDWTSKPAQRENARHWKSNHVPATVFTFENKLELLIADIETGRLLHFEKLGEFNDACTASDPAQHPDLQQLPGFTSNLLQSFKARLGEFHERTHLFKFINHPHACAVDSADLCYIPGVSVRDFERQRPTKQAFSHLKNIRSNLRSRLLDGSLNACMKLHLNKYQPDDKAISKPCSTRSHIKGKKYSS